MDVALSERAVDLVKAKGGVAAIDFIPPIAWGATSEVSVDTYLKGKNTSRYRKFEQDEVTIMVAPKLMRYAHRLEIVTRKRLVGSKLVAVAHHEHNAACRH